MPYVTDQPRLVHILPDGVLHDGDRIIPLDDPDFSSRVVESLSAWVERVHPSVLMEHVRDGSSSGYVQSVSRIQGRDGVWAELILRDDILPRFDRGEFRFVSPTIAWNFVADDNSRVDAALIEVSFVSVPRHATRQVAIDRIGDNHMMSTMSLEVSDEMSAPTLPLSPAQDLSMTVEELRAMVAEIVAEVVADLKAKADEPADESVTEAAEDGEDAAEAPVTEAAEDADEMAVEAETEEEDEADDAEVSMLRQELARLQAERAVDQDLAGRQHLSTMRERLVSVRASDPALYADVLSLLPASAPTQSSLSQHVTAGATPANDPGSESALDRANRIARERGISFREAYASLNL